MLAILSYTYENLEKTIVTLYIILIALVIVYAWTLINAKFCKSTDKATISHLDMVNKNNQDVIDELTKKVNELETDSEFKTSYIEDMEKSLANKNDMLNKLDEALNEIESIKVTIGFLENRIKTKDKVISEQSKTLESVSKKFSNLLCALTQPDTNYVMREYHGIKIFNGSDKQDVGEIGDSWCSMTEETNGGVIVERQVVYGECSANIVVKKFESGDIEFDKVNAMFLVEKLNEKF